MKKGNANIVISPMKEQDIEAVKQIETELELSAWSSDDYLKEIKREDSLSFTAVEKGKVVGFIIARLIMQDESSSLNSIEIEIYNIGVKKEYQNQGIGGRIFEEAVKSGLISEKNAGDLSIWLEVRESNEAALRFYTSKGFTVKYTRKNFYTNPSEDALILNLEYRKK